MSKKCYTACKCIAILGGCRVWLERRSPLLLPFEAKSQLASPSNPMEERSGCQSFMKTVMKTSKNI